MESEERLHLEGSMEPEQRLRLDYEHTAKYFHALADIRFKLLAVLPIATGSAIVVLGNGGEPTWVLPLSLLGLLATIGIMIYDQRNTELYDHMQRRAKVIEALLQFPAYDVEGDKKCGGAFIDRPRRGRKLLGLIPMWHDLGLAIVYSTTLGAWTFLFSRALVELRLPDNDPRTSAVAVGAAGLIALLVYGALILLDDPTDEQFSVPKWVRPMIWKKVEKGEPDESANFVHAGTAFGAGCGIALGAYVGAVISALGVGVLLGAIGGAALGSCMGYRSRKRALARTQSGN